MTIAKFQVVGDHLYALDHQGNLWCLELNKGGLPANGARWKEVNAQHTNSSPTPNEIEHA